MTAEPKLRLMKARVKKYNGMLECCLCDKQINQATSVWYSCGETCDYDLCEECWKIEMRRDAKEEVVYADYGVLMCERQHPIKKFTEAKSRGPDNDGSSVEC